MAPQKHVDTRPDPLRALHTLQDDQKPKKSSRKPPASPQVQEHVSKTAPKAPKSFLDLPGEIRNLIYEQVFSDRTWNLCPWQQNTQTGPNNALALLQTSRQIHAETELLPYTLSTFSARDSKRVRTWELQRTARQVGAVRKVEHLYQSHCLFLGNAPPVILDDLPWIRKLGSDVVKTIARFPGVKHIYLRFELGEGRSGCEKVALEQMRSVFVRQWPALGFSVEHAVVEDHPSSEQARDGVMVWLWRWMVGFLGLG